MLSDERILDLTVSLTLRICMRFVFCEHLHIDRILFHLVRKTWTFPYKKCFNFDQKNSNEKENN